jgi:predicted TIM-barrel fold metal-dependent hydrolase
MPGVFDFHARVGGGPQAVERLLATLTDWGIDRAAVCAGGMIDLDRLSAQVITGGSIDVDADNDAVLAACERAPDRLVPFFFGNPHRDAKYYRSRAEQFRALEVSPAVHGVPLADPRTLDLIDVAAEVGHPVYVVCLGRPGVGATDLALLAQRYPEVAFVLGHCGFVGIDVYALNCVADTPNIFAETSGCYTGVARAAISRLGADRVVFGTEYPLQHPSVELAKLQALALAPDSREAVVWRNAHRLLNEEAP